MRTEHLDNKINELEALRSRGELTYMGGEMLSEFNEIKLALTIHVVSNTEGKLLCEDCNKADRYLMFRACEPCLIKGKYIAK